MKTDSDFDALLAGLSPEETRRLQKILAEWAHGDENGFPVQLALLTKAQWRTAAAVPRFVETERKLLAELLGKARSDALATARSVQETMRVQMLSLQSEVTRQSTAVRDAAATILVRLTEAEALTTEIARTLQDGKKVWEEARNRFIDEGNSLAHSVGSRDAVKVVPPPPRASTLTAPRSAVRKSALMRHAWDLHESGTHGFISGEPQKTGSASC